MVCATCELHVGTHQGVPYSIGLRTQLSGQGFLKRMGAGEREKGPPWRNSPLWEHSGLLVFLCAFHTINDLGAGERLAPP